MIEWQFWQRSGQNLHDHLKSRPNLMKSLSFINEYVFEL